MRLLELVLFIYIGAEIQRMPSSRLGEITRESNTPANPSYHRRIQESS